MRRYLRNVFIICIGLLFFVPHGRAQDADKKTERHIYVLSRTQVGLNDIEQLLDTWETYTKKVVMANEYILSAKVFTQMYGDEWTVATLLEYASLTDLEKANERNEELAETFYPNEQERSDRARMLRSLFRESKSAIMRDVPALTK